MCASGGSFSPFASGGNRYEIRVAWGIAALVLIRLVVGAIVPLTFDEAYYWRLSKHLAAGYFDHPPMVAVVIRLGTVIAGDTELGVRLVAVLLALPATWAVWRSAAILFGDDRLGATAALFFNLTLMVAFGTVIVTPDAPLLVASAFVLFFLVKVMDTGDGVWWLAVGVALGAALLSKYTALFFGVSVLAWLLIAPEMRRWLLTPWPWLAAVLAGAMFTPVVVWNASHGWASFIRQFGRLVPDEFTLRYIGEYLGIEFGLTTPGIFVLGLAGLSAFLAGRGGTRCGRVLLGAMVWPVALYLTWHSLHQRVEGNWAAPVFPAFCIAAAAAVDGIAWQGFWKHLIDWSNKLALPIALGLAVLIDLQALFAIVPLGGSDPTQRELGAGVRQLATEIDAIRRDIGARGVLTTNYGLTGWLSFYLPSHAPVVEVDERYRWAAEPAPPSELFTGPLIYVCRAKSEGTKVVKQRYKIVEALATLVRQHRGVAIELYSVYRVGDPIADPLDNSTFAQALVQLGEVQSRARQLLAQGAAPYSAYPCAVVGTAAAAPP